MVDTNDIAHTKCHVCTLIRSHVAYVFVVITDRLAQLVVGFEYCLQGMLRL